ncbi:MAG: Gfo/Idh/MocA family oxidoreductase [Candidatus Hydrogenedentes bacterium]|nr:Gfo/Idh/MocA family oxidoreductase [Candidatus Hydrogenedentota bacterium]
MKVMWGVWGCGGIARRRTIPEGIIPADNAGLCCVWDTDPAAVRDVAAQFRAHPCHDEVELLSGACAALYIATPVHTHLVQVRRAAEAGKHILCEKPLGLNVAEAEEMAAICRANHVKLGTGLMMRFHAQHQAARELIQAGKLGVPVFARAQLSCWYPPIPGAWRQDPATGGGGALMDLGAHCLDLLEMFFGPIASVSCSIANHVHAYNSEDTAVVLVEFESGARGLVDVLFNVPDASSRNRLELYGTQGCILAEGTIGQGEMGEMTVYLEDDAKNYEAQQARAAAETVRITPVAVNMYRAEIEAFSQAILDDAPPPIDGEAGLRIQKILAACYTAAATGAKTEIATACKVG